MVPQRIEVDGDHVTFIWEDDTVGTLTAHELRRSCECAVCGEPGGQAATDAVLGGDRPVSIDDAELVGGYAMSFTFGPDGHAAGIYPFDRLRSLSEASS